MYSSVLEHICVRTLSLQTVSLSLFHLLAGVLEKQGVGAKSFVTPVKMPTQGSVQKLWKRAPIPVLPLIHLSVNNFFLKGN